MGTSWFVRAVFSFCAVLKIDGLWNRILSSTCGDGVYVHATCSLPLFHDGTLAGEVLPSIRPSLSVSLSSESGDVRYFLLSLFLSLSLSRFLERGAET